MNLDAIAGDNGVNIAEKATGFAISGDTGSQSGVSVTVTVGTTELTATSASADLVGGGAGGRGLHRRHQRGGEGQRDEDRLPDTA